MEHTKAVHQVRRSTKTKNIDNDEYDYYYLVLEPLRSQTDLIPNYQIIFDVSDLHWTANIKGLTCSYLPGSFPYQLSKHNKYILELFNFNTLIGKTIKSYKVNEFIR